MNAPPREALARRSGSCPLCLRPIHHGDSIRKTCVGWVHARCGASYEQLRRENAEADR